MNLTWEASRRFFAASEFHGGPVLLARELLNRRRWSTRARLANAIFEYLEIFHNRQRRHSALGMRTPVDYEIIHQTRDIAA